VRSQSLTPARYRTRGTAHVAGDAGELPSPEDGLPRAAALGAGDVPAVRQGRDMGPIVAEHPVVEVVVGRQDVLGTDGRTLRIAAEAQGLRERVGQREVEGAPLPGE